MAFPILLPSAQSSVLLRSNRGHLKSKELGFFQNGFCLGENKRPYSSAEQSRMLLADRVFACMAQHQHH